MNNEANRADDIKKPLKVVTIRDWNGEKPWWLAWILNSTLTRVVIIGPQKRASQRLCLCIIHDARVHSTPPNDSRMIPKVADFNSLLLDWSRKFNSSRDFHARQRHHKKLNLRVCHCISVCGLHAISLSRFPNKSHLSNNVIKLHFKIFPFASRHKANTHCTTLHRIHRCNPCCHRTSTLMECTPHCYSGMWNLLMSRLSFLKMFFAKQKKIFVC